MAFQFDFSSFSETGATLDEGSLPAGYSTQELTYQTRVQQRHTATPPPMPKALDDNVGLPGTPAQNDDPFGIPGEAVQPDDPFGIPGVPVQEDDPFAIPGEAVQPDDPFAIPAPPMQADDAFAIPVAPVQEDDPFAIPVAPVQEDDPFAIPGESVQPDDPFAVPAPPMQPHDPFALPMAPVQEDDPFAIPGESVQPDDPFADTTIPKQPQDPFAVPITATPPKDPFAESSIDPFAAPSSAISSKDDPFTTEMTSPEPKTIPKALKAIPQRLGKEQIALLVGQKTTNLPYKAIKEIALGAIKSKDRKPYLALDLTVPSKSGNKQILRITSGTFTAKSLIPKASSEQMAFMLLVNHLAKSSGAINGQAEGALKGKPYASYPDEAAFTQAVH